jgi:CHAT domain-containing protein
MTPEEALIHRLEAAGATELAEIIDRATPEQERTLRLHLGDERFDRMRTRVRRTRATRGRRAVSGNVVVVHGIMGGELSAYRGDDADLVWVSIPRIVIGRLSRLQLGPDGTTDGELGWNVRASGILKKYYGDLLLWLAEDWDVRPFFFDWRKSLDLAARDLNDRINEWFPNQPVHIVAHSMGGLVSRTFIANHRETWKRMWDERGAGRTGGRLVMLGTPNHGSFAIPQVITGLEPLVQKMSTADLVHDTSGLQAIFNTFPGSLQMLPSPLKYGSLKPLYQAETYGSLGISQTHLTAALNHHYKLATVIEPDRMSYVAGYNQPTFSYVDPNLKAMANLQAYAVTNDGDGRVPHVLGRLDGVTTYYIETDHGGLSEKEPVFSIVEDLLSRGKSSVVPTELPARAPSSRSGRGPAPAHTVEEQAWRDEIRRGTADDVAAIEALTRRRAAVRGAGATRPTDEDRRAEELMLRGVLGSGAGIAKNAAAPEVVEAGAISVAPKAIPATARITVRLIQGSIADVHDLTKDGEDVDAISVGHYIGVAPQAAEKAIDDALTAAPAGAKRTRRSRGKRQPRGAIAPKGMIAQFTERGILRGGLGEPFFIDDPRPAGKNKRARLITLIGLGEPGRLGAPELLIAVRELCWAMGRLRRRHLATVLIGAGPGNLPIPDAVSSWMRGVRRALLEGGSDGAPAASRLESLTIVEAQADRMGAIADALKAEVKRQRLAGLEIDLHLPSGYRKSRTRTDEPDLPPTVVTVGTHNDGYVFAALTENASVPERVVAVDRTLVEEANALLAGASDTARQRSLGRTLLNLVMPNDLRGHLRSSAPIVMVVDANTARLHWEMMADGQPESDVDDAFLATGRGFTRQLRTSFAPPPEPTPPSARTLRVLVVADPAADEHLPGAAIEGVEVAKLFRQFNAVHARSGHQVEVTTLFGPEQASRVNVVEALTEQTFDVMHFAGHCAFNDEDPADSGWIFTGGLRLRARELKRIDRIPRFIFSNACESGITPERASARAIAAAPSFAEGFFERGVANFICTAWTVDDGAALTFALNLYRQLLGLQDPKTGTPGRFTTMSEALRAARGSIVEQADGGIRTWGAYQHYGSPNYRFFEAAPAPARNGGTSGTRRQRSERA